MVNIALHISLKNFEQQRNGRAYPAIIPTAHVIAPYHCFQLFCRVIRTSSAVAVKQLVRYTIRLLGLCVIPTARGEKSCRFIREIPLILEPLVFLVQPLYPALQRPDLLRQAHCYSVRSTRTIMAHELRQFINTSEETSLPSRISTSFCAAILPMFLSS